MKLGRRTFTAGLAASFASTGLGFGTKPAAAQSYRGPNVIIIRFGGGVRRRETIDRTHTFAPFLRHELTKKGVLIPDMRIASLQGVETSHAEGTLNILAGRYLAYRNLGTGFPAQHLEPTAPTLFEYLRKAYRIPAHRALLINGEDRPQEEFFTFGVHRHYGIAYRSETLSLYRFKLHKFRRQLERGEGTDKELAAAQKQLDELLRHDHRKLGPRQTPPVEAFWSRWQRYFGKSGFVNPRGDRLLTELAIRALRELRPRLMMVNYQDPDYVHWGNPSHYTRAITVIDQELRRLVNAVELDEEYRDRTVFVIVPDCGRDSNPLMDVPFQHHFNTRSAHKIWALIFGPGIARGKTLDKVKDQTSIAATVGAIMGFRARRAEGDVLEEIFV